MSTLKLTYKKIKANTAIFLCLCGLVFMVSSCNNNFPKEEMPNRSYTKLNVYTTADSTDLKIQVTDTLAFSEFKQPLETQICVFVYPDKQYQTFMGIGGAITDASAEVFAALPEARQNEFLDAYFDKQKGLGYNIIRTNMNSCDFSSGSYTYVQEGDKELKTFDIAHDRKFKIPLIKKAIAKAKDAYFYFSPWSPPAFMKTNNDVLHGGKLKPEYYQSWADYYVKFTEQYQKEGIPVWGMSIQNEPMAIQRWESCIYTAEEERDFLKNHLGPTLQKAGFADKKIIVWDHNRDLITQRADVILNDPEASKYVWGVGFHWYEDWSGGQPMFQNVGAVYRDYPDKNLFFTEGCAESFSEGKYQFWGHAKEYATAMIHDFNNGMVGWTDWNILLDQNGGPNHVANFCFAPVHGNTETGELIFTPSFYVIGHFSKFIKPGAKRISSSPSRSDLLSTSFINPDGELVTVVLNTTDRMIPYYLCVDSKAVQVEILPNAIQTLIY